MPLITKRKVQATSIDREFSVSEPKPGTTAFNEADSNADTCCLGKNFIVLHFTNRTADVYPYDESYTPITNVPIVTGATAIDLEDGLSYILIVNEALYYGMKLDHSLINPNQVRHAGVDFWDNPYDYDHELSIDVDRGPFIPLKYDGTKLRFQSRAPSSHELETLQHIELTSSTPWEPTEVTLGEVKAKVKISKTQAIMNARERRIFSVKTGNGDNKSMYYDPSSDDAIIHSIEPSLIKLKELITMRQIASVETSNIEFEHLDAPARRTFISNERHKKANALTLSENWGIGLKKAKATLEATTQNSIRSAILPLSRRYRSDRYYNVKRLNGKFATDTLYADIKSLNQHKYAQIYSHKCGFTVANPMDKFTGDSVGYTLQDFINDFGVPEFLTFDGALQQKGNNTLFMKNIRKHNIKYHISGPYRPNENPAESAIGQLKLRWYRIMMKKRVPRRLWDHGLIWICETGNLTVSSSRYANGRPALEIITGESCDISEYLDFSFYDWVIYHPNAGLGEMKLGKWLGVSHKIGNLMSYWILTENAKPISCTTVQSLTMLEQQTDEWKKRMQLYEDKVEKLLETMDDPSQDLSDVPRYNHLALEEADEDFRKEFQKVINDKELPDVDDADESAKETFFDYFVNMELGLPRGDIDGELEFATVKKRAVGEDGEPIGVHHKNPFLDTRKYEVEYRDGTIEIMSANTIAENLLAQVDEEGHRQLLLDEIIDHRSNDTAIKREDGFIERKGQKYRKLTTRGWELCVQWKDGSTNWIALKDLKDSYPVELATYARDNKLVEEPAFAWWVPYTLKKSKVILSKIKSKYWQRTHKYGIRIPKTVKEAIQLDIENKNTYWQDAIKEEMKKIREAFTEYNGNIRDLVGYQEITVHMIFDIKLGENFRRKARLVGDGHKTETPASVTYSTVVSRDSVRIALLIAALNDLDIMSADIENAYLTAPCREKCWTRAGMEFGHEEGKIFIVTKALYGLKSSGAAFRQFLAETLENMGFTSSEADPDVWLRPAVKPDGETYYEYILCYVDDVLAISHKALDVLKEVQKDFKLKKDKIETPDIYLGAKLEKKLLNGKEVWTMSSKDYCQYAIKNILERAMDYGIRLPSRFATPMDNSYVPELDASEEVDSEKLTFYQEIIGILRWMIEIGRVDIHHEVSLLSSYQASPRQGHLEQAVHICMFLKKKPKLTLYFDPTLPKLDQSMFDGCQPSENFKDHYRDAKEELPQRMPVPRGRSVKITSFVDASHAANKVTRRSHTGFIIFLNRAPIIWYSKKQNTVESSTFSSEFIAAKVCMEYIVALRYKLYMFGIPVDGPADMLCDNQSVVNNCTKLESTLNKKHCSIAYHAVRWAVAAGIIRVGKIDTGWNIADAMTKRLTVAKRDTLFGEWTY